MKRFKVLVFAAMFLSLQVQTVDIPAILTSCGKKVGEYSYDLMTDTTTQVTSLGSIVFVAGGYMYYQQQSSLACLDGHQNGRIMQKSNLMHVTYFDFLDIIESIDSYASTLEFINQHCIDSFFFTSHSKINRFIALTDDLQVKNNKRADDCLDKENMILENFKNNLVLAQANIAKELLNDAINANKNATNLYSVRQVLDIVSRLLSFFGNK